ncbi:NfeD family protein [Caulobacter sp. 17J80-11]|uniref:NfeD family protein n=1 Tax=Caulobacter sp. 17J80-11 TaxID=2763502 RepID=UPI001653B460|nr:NfeD family protein [Caulobacter sp. 17J80-11]MBC6983067.1 NfeD family protein [Caulobacter sp. 17J80-11]
MEVVTSLYETHPFWVWLTFGAALLAIEAAANTEWLLWPAAAAGLTALFTLLGLRLGAPVELLVFAGLTLLTTLGGRKLVSRVQGVGHDINDQRLRLIGLAGQAAGPIAAGHGRVFVDGAEWPAELEGGGDLPAGARVTVTNVSGARLTVRAVG